MVSVTVSDAAITADQRRGCSKIAMRTTVEKFASQSYGHEHTTVIASHFYLLS